MSNANPPSRYWFARRFPLTDKRNAMAPVSPEGFRVAWTFVGWMVGGAIGAGLTLLLGLWVPYLGLLAPVVFIACAIYGGWYFITQAQTHGDHQHTVADYKAGRVQ